MSNIRLEHSPDIIAVFSQSIFAFSLNAFFFFLVYCIVCPFFLQSHEGYDLN